LPAKRVLIVGQDDTIKTMLHDLLEEVWVDLDAVIDGEPQSLVEKVLAQRPDLIIVDVYLAHRSAELDTIRRLKSSTATNQTPILALAEPHEGLPAARQAGADRVLAKPFDLADLASLVREHIGESQ
jgi:CheY-like chemotaxis protein